MPGEYSSLGFPRVRDRTAYLYCLQDGSIFILEDRVNFGRLLHYDNGRLDILASRLRSPQSIVIGPDGAYYLAEQRRNRILRIWQGSNNLTSPNR